VKSLGKGKIYFIGALINEYNLAALLISIFENEHIDRPYELVQTNDTLVPNIETVIFDRDSKKGVFLHNWDLYTKFGYLKPHSSFIKTAMYAYNPLDGKAFISPSGKSLWTPAELASQGIPLIMHPHDRTLVVFSKQPWEKTKLTPTTVTAQLIAFNQAVVSERMQAKRAAEHTKANNAHRAFDVDPDKCFTINIRRFCNRQFIDKIPGDGKGGWTDQGKDNSLLELEPGIKTWLNVPFDIIRYDQNNDTSCIVLASKSVKSGLPRVKGIKVNRQAKRLYFLHTAAWVKKAKPAIKYQVNYADKSKVEIIINAARRDSSIGQIGDWWKPFDINDSCRLGWENSKKHGLYIFEWKNLQPKKIITSIDILSFNNEIVPIIIAISGEH
jgi:hypothetical protein